VKKEFESHGTLLVEMSLYRISLSRCPKYSCLILVPLSHT